MPSKFPSKKNNPKSSAFFEDRSCVLAGEIVPIEGFVSAGGAEEPPPTGVLKVGRVEAADGTAAAADRVTAGVATEDTPEVPPGITEPVGTTPETKGEETILALENSPPEGRDGGPTPDDEASAVDMLASSC